MKLISLFSGEYDPDKLRFDHHQRSFNETFASVTKTEENRLNKVKLSSAGLIYCHYGLEILKKLSPVKEDHFLNKLFVKIYEGLIQEVDGIDNGIPMFDGEPVYTISTHLGARVSRFNATWNETGTVDEMSRFEKAMVITLEEFQDRITYFSTAWWPARELVHAAIQSRFSVHESGKILELKQACPWKSHYFELEEEMNLGDHVRFLIFQDESAKNWRVQAVSLNEKSFVLRTPLYKSWMGLRDEELTEVSGIPGCIFAHANGFIGGNKTREGALSMAIKTLQLTEEDEKADKKAQDTL